MPLDLDSLSNSDIALLCQDPSAILRGDPSARCLSKISDDVIVKCGWSITDEEAANQEFVYKFSRTCDLKVPKIYRHFRIDNIGYIVMEFIDGTSLEKVSFHEHPGLIQRLGKAIHGLFQQISVDFPGPRNGGIPRGYLFSEDGAGTTLNSMPKLNEWLNERLILGNDELGFDFDLSDCRFCHLDLSRRNIIMCPDGSFCLLDWEHAGVYPAVFETYCLLFGRQFDYDFSQKLLDDFEHLVPNVDGQDKTWHIELLDRVYRNNMRYSFSKTDSSIPLEEFDKVNTFPFPINPEDFVVRPPPPPVLSTETAI